MATRPGPLLVSEWWVEPHSNGPGAHRHEANDEIFYVTEGTASVLVGDVWYDAPKGSFLLDPGRHYPRLRQPYRRPACLFNVFIPGGFERNMPAIVKWFEDNPESAGDRRTASDPRDKIGRSAQNASSLRLTLARNAARDRGVEASIR